MANKARLAALLLFSCLAFGSPKRAIAAEVVPGDACTGAGNYTVSGGPELSGAGHMMVCSGSVWKSIIDFDATANSTLPYALRLSGDITPTALAANTDNWAPANLATASVIRMSASAAYNLTGLTGGVDGRIITLVNVGTFAITLKNSVTSTTANQFLFTADLPLAANETATIMYDSTASRWKLLAKGSATASGGATTIDALTDAFTDYTSVSNFIMGRPGATALTAGAEGNTFIGVSAGASTANSTATTSGNIAIGALALASLTSGNDNIAVGSYALYNNTTGAANAAFGVNTLGANTTGIANNGFGRFALGSNVGGGSNAAFGSGSLSGLTAGNYNVAFGESSLVNLVTGDSNIGIGALVGESQTSGYKNIIIGSDIDLANATASNQLNIGNIIYGTAIDGFNGTLSTGNIASARKHRVRSLITLGRWLCPETSPRPRSPRTPTTGHRLVLPAHRLSAWQAPRRVI